jgi:hypothetical protein
MAAIRTIFMTFMHLSPIGDLQINPPPSLAFDTGSVPEHWMLAAVEVWPGQAA